jgi:cell division protein FtsL
MTKKKNRKKRGNRDMNFLAFTCFFVLFSGILYFVSSLGLKTYNNTLSIRKQSIASEIAALEAQNSSLDTEIRQLASSDRVNAVAASDGLTYNQNSITSVSEGTAKTDGE